MLSSPQDQVGIVPQHRPHIEIPPCILCLPLDPCFPFDALVSLFLPSAIRKLVKAGSELIDFLFRFLVVLAVRTIRINELTTFNKL